MHEILRNLRADTFVLDLGCARGSFQEDSTVATVVRIDRDAPASPLYPFPWLLDAISSRSSARQSGVPIARCASSAWGGPAPGLVRPATESPVGSCTSMRVPVQGRRSLRRAGTSSQEDSLHGRDLSAFYFGNVAGPIDTRAWRNVCIRCGSGASASSLRSQDAVHSFFLGLRLHRCPHCDASNPYVDDR